MVSDKQGGKRCAWKKLKAASGHRLVYEALGSASCWLRARPLGTASQGECVLGVIQKEFFPREFFLEVSQNLRRKAPMASGLATILTSPSKPTRWIQIHSGREGGISESPSPTQSSSRSQSWTMRGSQHFSIPSATQTKGKLTE